MVEKVKKSKKDPVFTFESIPDDEKDFFVRNLEKRNRNITKKMKEIESLEQLAESKELKPEQQKKVQSKDDCLQKRAQLEQVLKFYLEARLEDKVSFQANSQTEQQSNQQQQPQISQEQIDQQTQKAVEEAVQNTRSELARQILNLSHIAIFFRNRQTTHVSQDVSKTLYDFFEKVFLYPQSVHLDTNSDILGQATQELTRYLTRDNSPALQNKTYNYLHETVEKLASQDKDFLSLKGEVQQPTFQSPIKQTQAIGSEMQSNLHQQQQIQQPQEVTEHIEKKQPPSEKASPVKEPQATENKIQTPQKNKTNQKPAAQTQQSDSKSSPVKKEPEAPQVQQEEEKQVVQQQQQPVDEGSSSEEDDRQQREDNRSQQTGDQWLVAGGAKKEKPKEGENNKRFGDRPYRPKGEYRGDKNRTDKRRSRDRDRDRDGGDRQNYEKKDNQERDGEDRRRNDRRKDFKGEYRPKRRNDNKPTKTEYVKKDTQQNQQTTQ